MEWQDGGMAEWRNGRMDKSNRGLPLHVSHGMGQSEDASAHHGRHVVESGVVPLGIARTSHGKPFLEPLLCVRGALQGGLSRERNGEEGVNGRAA